MEETEEGEETVRPSVKPKTSFKRKGVLLRSFLRERAALAGGALFQDEGIPGSRALRGLPRKCSRRVFPPGKSSVKALSMIHQEGSCTASIEGEENEFLTETLSTSAAST